MWSNVPVLAPDGFISTYEVTTAWVTIAPNAESASLLFSDPVRSSQIPMQLKIMRLLIYNRILNKLNF